MTSSLLTGLSITAALGAGLIAGVFFAFSSFIMRALRDQPPAAGIAVMQAINVTVLNASFLGVFLGTGGLSVALIILTVTGGGDAGGSWRLAGAALYLLGTLGVTVGGSVPRNIQLAALDSGSPDAMASWDRFQREWTTLNTGRTIAALLAAACFIGSLVA